MTKDNRLRGAIYVLTLFFLVLPSIPCRADVGISGALGIAGRYRPGGWIPVTVSVQKSDSETIRGQVQALAQPDPMTAANRQSGGTPPSTLYAVRATLSGGPASISEYRLYIRNIDPGLDNLTLHFVDGEERGDGRVLASKSMDEGTSTVPGIAGIPVPDNDVWIVGFAGDPSAFSFLGSQNLGLVHTHGGARFVSSVPQDPANPYAYGMPSAFPPPKVQISGAGVADLPNKAAGYNGVDCVMLRSDAPLDSLSESQTDALRDWVAGGGHLAVAAGNSADSLSASWLHDMLPAYVDTTARNVRFPTQAIGEVAAYGLTPKAVPGVQVLVASGGAPLAVSGTFGAGMVTLTAFDPTSRAFQTWSGPAEESFWRNILTGGEPAPSSVLAYVAGREEGHPSFTSYSNNAQFAGCLLNIPKFDAPGSSAIALFLVFYIIVLVPLNYLVLKRLDKREWAWATIPAMVILFSAATYAVGYSTKGSTMFVDRVAIAETSTGSSIAGIYSAFGIFAPRRASYDLTWRDPEALIAEPDTTRNYRWSGSQSADDSAGYPPVLALQTDGDSRLLNTSINMWSMRTFDVASIGSLGGPVNVSIRWNQASQLMRGSVTNLTAYRLTDCWFCYGANAQSVGDILPGATAGVAIGASSQQMPAAPSFYQPYIPYPMHYRGRIGHSMKIYHGRGQARQVIVTAPGGYYGPVRYSPPRFYNTQAAQSSPAFPDNAFSDIPQGEYDNQRSGLDVQARMRGGMVGFIRSLGPEGQDYYYGRGTGPTDEPHIDYQPKKDEAILAGWTQDSGPLDAPLAIDGRTPDENRLTLVIIHVPMPSPGASR